MLRGRYTEVTASGSSSCFAFSDKRPPFLSKPVGMNIPVDPPRFSPSRAGGGDAPKLPKHSKLAKLPKLPKLPKPPKLPKLQKLRKLPKAAKLPKRASAPRS